MPESGHDNDHARWQRLQDDGRDRARAVFGGLAPRGGAAFAPTSTATVVASAPASERSTPSGRAAVRMRNAARSTMPIVLTGAIALGIGLAAPADSAHAAPRTPVSPKPQQALGPNTLRAALAHVGAAIMPGALGAQAVATAAAPAQYTVVAGDTVSGIAGQFGLSTASVLALNGLSWKSTIFPGQRLTLAAGPAKVAAASTPAATGGQYAIRSGDTLSAIAARFGTSTQSILGANGLGWSSIIYPGQVIVIPGTAAAPVADAVHAAHITTGDAADAPIAEAPALPGPTAAPAAAPAAPAAPAVAAPAAPASPVAPVPGGVPAPPTSTAPPAGTISPLSSEGRQHAATIIQAGRQLGVPDYGIVIALATAMQESSMRNLTWGDRDSVGLFQQRPSTGWGTVAELQTPTHAARLFYVGREGITRGLLDIPGWQSMSLTRAAQAVQISAYPDHYAKWESSAWAWLYELT